LCAAGDLGDDEEDEYMHGTGETRSDEWGRNLNFYLKLNKKFTDIVELYSHLAEFREYRLRTIGSLQQRAVASISHLGKRNRDDNGTSYGRLSDPGDAEMIFIRG